MEKLGPVCVAGRECNGAAAVENNAEWWAVSERDMRTPPKSSETHGRGVHSWPPKVTVIEDGLEDTWGVSSFYGQVRVYWTQRPPHRKQVRAEGGAFFPVPEAGGDALACEHSVSVTPTDVALF